MFESLAVAQFTSCARHPLQHPELARRVRVSIRG